MTGSWLPESNTWALSLTGVAGDDFNDDFFRQQFSDILDNEAGQNAYPDDVATQQGYAITEAISGEDGGAVRDGDKTYTVTLSGNADSHTAEVVVEG